MVTTTRALTYDDLLLTPDDDQRYEIIGGKLFVSASPVLKHQQVLVRLSDRLYDLEKVGLGYHFVGPTDVQLSPHNIVVPDLLFVRAERRSILSREKIEGAPDIVIEVLSPSTRDRDLGVKLELYERFGVGEYWIVDPVRDTVRAMSHRDSGYQPIPKTGEILQSTVVPGFFVDVTELFSGLL